jgi:hypothetical protein
MRPDRSHNGSMRELCHLATHAAALTSILLCPVFLPGASGHFAEASETPTTAPSTPPPTTRAALAVPVEE